MLQTSITPVGTFRVGVHKPAYFFRNFREHDHRGPLGTFADHTVHDNRANFPDNDVREDAGRWIYEIANAFPFRGTTYIDSGWAEARAADPTSICMPKRPPSSLTQVLGNHLTSEQIQDVFKELPPAIRYDCAANSTDPYELVQLARMCCRMVFDDDGQPTGLCYEKSGNRVRPAIDDFELFETIANNPFLPDVYKEVMVLRPGVQGDSEIIGDWQREKSHVVEYLRRNSYIPWGHFAANMAHDAVRYRTSELRSDDMQGLRHLYYQRIYTILADSLNLAWKFPRRSLCDEELEALRVAVVHSLAENTDQTHPATLWGWNFGYDFSGSGYRLHASHQMIHQQYAMVPEKVEQLGGGAMTSYCCGDLIADTLERYQAEHGQDFFTDYLRAIGNNTRLDNRDAANNLVVYKDEHVMLFVPKAQVSQWELQLLVLADSAAGPVGNVVEADTRVRASIDEAILLAQHIFAGLGAEMVTSIEYSKRLGLANGQRLLYSFLPKLPWSMGGFSEAQLRFICGHYPEDFAIACRHQIEGKNNT